MEEKESGKAGPWVKTRVKTRNLATQLSALLAEMQRLENVCDSLRSEQGLQQETAFWAPELPAELRPQPRNAPAKPRHTSEHHVRDREGALLRRYDRLSVREKWCRDMCNRRLRCRVEQVQERLAELEATHEQLLQAKHAKETDAVDVKAESVE